jgi:preprotein translocase subunit SecA
LKAYERYKELGKRGRFSDSMASLFRRAQRKVERKHFRDRMALMYHEKERTRIQREMGLDPYLDSAD